MSKQTSMVVVQDANGYLKQLQEFHEHVETTEDALMNLMEATGEYDEAYDIIIEVNGKKCKIELHADAYSRLMGMIEDEITEYTELNRIVGAHNG